MYSDYDCRNLKEKKQKIISPNIQIPIDFFLYLSEGDLIKLTKKMMSEKKNLLSCLHFGSD